MDRHIVAIGGGGFGSNVAEDPLDSYILSLVKGKRPRVCFIGTATGDAEGYVAKFYRAFSKRGCECSDLSLYPYPPPDINGLLTSQDIIYVGGGNTANMLALWRLHGVDKALRLAWEKGVILCGVSAGAICWFEACVTDSFGPQLAGMRDGLGFLKGSACPHYNGEALRRPVYTKLIADGFPPGIAIDEGVAVHFVNDELFKVVSTGAGAYQVQIDHGKVVESPLARRILNSSVTSGP